jgi:hypothetical protein
MVLRSCGAVKNSKSALSGVMLLRSLLCDAARKPADHEREHYSQLKKIAVVIEATESVASRRARDSRSLKISMDSRTKSLSYMYRCWQLTRLLALSALLDTRNERTDGARAANKHEDRKKAIRAAADSVKRRWAEAYEPRAL